MNASDVLAPPYVQPIVISAYIYIGIFSLLTLFTLVFVWLRQNYQPLKIRAPHFVMLHLICSWIVVIGSVIRIIAGRALYPCFLYLFLYNMAVPMVCVPNLVRMYRFVLIFRVSHIKSISSTSEDDMFSSNRKSVFVRWSRILASTKVLASMTFFLLFIHVMIWALIGVGFKFGVPSRDIFQLAGCSIDVMGISYVPLGYVIFYALIIIVLLLLLISGVKETYGIRLESLGLTVMWVIALIPFTVLVNAPSYGIPDARIELNYYPSGTSLFIGAFIDIFITGTLPVILTYTKKYSNAIHISTDEIRQTLENYSYRVKFKDYAMRSLCVESIIFWEEVQKFKRLTDHEDRETMIHHLYEKYMVHSSPFELNIQQSSILPIEQAMQEYRANGTPIDDDVFTSLEEHCVEDMRDVFSRFIETQVGSQIHAEIKKHEAELSIMEQTGMVTTRQGTVTSRSQDTDRASWASKSELVHPLLERDD